MVVVSVRSRCWEIERCEEFLKCLLANATTMARRASLDCQDGRFVKEDDRVTE